MTPKSWYKIAAKKHDDGDDGGHAEILIYGEIGLDWFGDGIAAEGLVKELAELDVATLDVRINSIGGQVFEGLAIFNALDRHPAKVTTHIDGMAASIASIVALAGDTVKIAENAFVMIHNAHGLSMGNANDMRKMAGILEKLDGSLADTYVAKTGKSEKVIRAMMDEETWFNAEEALEAGMVDEVVEAMDIAASFDLSKFHNLRPDVLDRAASMLSAIKEVDRTTFVPEVDPGASVKLPLEFGPLQPAPADAEQDELIRLAAEVEETLSRTIM